MPILAGLSLVIQICFAIHVVRTGREVFWIYIIIFVPAIGCAVYFATQVLPELGQNRTVNNAGHSIIKTIDPNRELRRKKEELELADTLHNRLELADECLKSNYLEQAISLYEGCLKGPHKNDPDIMLKLASTYFQADSFEKCKLTLENTIQINPEFKSADSNLLYARSLENLELTNDSLLKYEEAVLTYLGEEARIRYGLLLKKTGQLEKADAVFNETLARAKRSPKYYRKKEKRWIQLAHKNLAS